MINLNELNNLSEQELDTIVKRISAIRSEERQTKIRFLIERFKDAWDELESEGVDICCNDYYESGDPLDLDSIDFNY
jgi:hypothetical protein